MDSAKALGVFVAAATCLAIVAAVPARRGARIEDPAPAVEPGRFAQGVIEEIVGELRRRDAGREGGADGAQLDTMLRDLGVPVPRNGTPSGASDRSVAQSIQSRAGDEVNRRMPQLLTSLARLKSGRLPRRRPAPVASRPAPGAEPSTSPSAPAPVQTSQATPFFGGGGGGGVAGTPVVTPSATPSATPSTPPGATPVAPPTETPGATPAVPPDAPPSSPPDDAAEPAVPPVPAPPPDTL